MNPLQRPASDIQRDEARKAPTSSQRLTGDLVDFEQKRAAQHLERLADAQIVLTLQLQQFDSRTPEWGTFARALAEYGFEVFRAWGRAGVLRQMVARHGGVMGLSRLPEGLTLDEDDADALSAELNMTSIETFRRTLMNPARTWRLDGGASLKTYYVGRCLLDLPVVYYRWRKREAPLNAVDIDGVDADPTPRVEPPSVQADRRAKIVALIPDSLTRSMFVLQDEGYSLTEIAEMLSAGTGENVTESMVRTRMTRARVRGPDG